MIGIKKLDDIDWYYKLIKPLLVNRNEYRGNELAKAINKKINQINDKLAIIFEKDEEFKNITFENLITYDFYTLKKLKKIIDDLKKTRYSSLFDTNSRGAKDKFKENIWNDIYKAYGKLSGENINNKMVERLGITVCPYCNRNYINNINKEKTSAQLDHYFNKNDYPIFALSFYNLVPSCYNCNHTKSTNDLSRSPYESEYEFDENIKITYLPTNIDFMDNPKSIKVKVKSSEDLRLNVETLHLNEAYEVHKDYIQELIYKRKINNEVSINEIFENFKGLFSTKEEMIKIVYGNYVKKDELHKRPLAKLTRDICLELDIKVD